MNGNGNKNGNVNQRKWGRVAHNIISKSQVVMEILKTCLAEISLSGLEGKLTLYEIDNRERN